MIDLTSNDLTQEDLTKYILQKDSELDTDVNSRIYGVVNRTGKGYRRAGYQIQRDFYDGDQWLYTKQDGGTMRVYNYCFTTVHNYAAFLTNESIDIDIETDPLDDTKVALASACETVINKILEQGNRFSQHFEGGAINGSLIGDTMFIGPFWNKKKKKIWFQNVRKPEFIRIIWSDTNYYDRLGYIMHYRISMEEAEIEYGEIFRANGWVLQSNASESESASTVNSKKGRSQGPAGNEQEVPGQFVTVLQFWGEKYSQTIVDGHVLEFVKHDYGFVPLLYVPNTPHPTLAYGVSDVENMLDPQVEYNETTSDVRDILRQDAFATIFGKNLQIQDYKTGTMQILDVGDEGEIMPDPRRDTSGFVEAYAKDRFTDVNNLSGVPEVIYGGPRVREATGRALSVLMQGVNNRVKARQNRWQPELIQFINNVLRLMEIYVPGAKNLIPDDYQVSIFFPSVLVRDVVEEINKFNAKIQSQTTTMKNIGIGNPVQEQKLMKKELSDDALMLEISKQPQLQMQMQEQMAAQIAQKTGGAGPGNPTQPPNGSPALPNDQNQGGDNPLPAPGNASPSSPGGKNNRSAQKGGAAVPKKS